MVAPDAARGCFLRKSRGIETKATNLEEFGRACDRSNLFHMRAFFLAFVRQRLPAELKAPDENPPIGIVPVIMAQGTGMVGAAAPTI
jgi:hypothetical protein